LHLTLVHEGDLEIKIDPADYQEKDEHDVRDRGMEIATYFARKESVKFSHVLSIASMSRSRSKSDGLHLTLIVGR
jgi:hypothetical protein